MISLLDFPVPSCLKVIRESIRWQYEIMNANIWQSTKMGCHCHLPICTNLYDEYSKVPPPLAVDQRPSTQYVMMAHVNISATWHQDLRQSDLILQAIFRRGKYLIEQLGFDLLLVRVGFNRISSSQYYTMNICHASIAEDILCYIYLAFLNIFCFFLFMYKKRKYV